MRGQRPGGAGWRSSPAGTPTSSGPAAATSPSSSSFRPLPDAIRTADRGVPWWLGGVRTEWRAEAAGLIGAARRRREGRDLALIAAGLTFYAGIAVVPLLVVTFALTALLTSAATVRELGDQLVALLPGQLGAPAAVGRLVSAGISLDVRGGQLALLPMSLYGEGLRRALLRFSGRRDSMTAWRGRLLALPLLALTPLLLYPLLLAAREMAHLAETGAPGCRRLLHRRV